MPQVIHSIRFYMKEEERQEIINAAWKSRMSISEFVHHVVMKEVEKRRENAPNIVLD